MTAEAARRLTAREIADLTGGRLVGSGEVTVSGVAPLDRAGPDHVAFLASASYLSYFQRSTAGVVLCRAEHEREPGGPATRVVVADPYAALLAILPVLHPQPVWAPGIHSTVAIGPGARWEEPVSIGPHAVLGADVRLGRNARIGAGCVLGDGVAIGDDALLFPRVVCYPGTVIGHRVILHGGVVLGSDGFGYVRGRAGEGHHKIPHVGRCVIGDDVEIGANSTVDRGSVDDTVIGDGTKIDNLVQVGHNVRIGARCLLMAQVGVGGSTRIADDCILAGQAGIIDHLHLGRGAQVGAQAGVIGDLAPGTRVSGYPAREHRQYLRGQAALYRLARIVDELEQLVRDAHGVER